MNFCDSLLECFEERRGDLFQFSKELIQKLEIVIYPNLGRGDPVPKEVEKEILEGGAAFMLGKQGYYHVQQMKNSVDRRFLQRTRLSKNLAGNVRTLTYIKFFLDTCIQPSESLLTLNKMGQFVQ